MGRYLLMALNGPTDGEGNAEALEKWYEEEHMPGFKAIAGITSARRYDIVRGKVNGVNELWPKITVYEIETDDFPAVQKQIAAEMQSFHPSLDRSRSAFLMCAQVSGDA